MKANELMIGDLVNIYVFPNESPKEKDLFPAKITTIMTPLPNEQGGEHIECIFKSEDGGIGCAARPVNTCRPIPLTPEILEKNGWKHEFDKKDYMVKYNLAVEGKNCWMMWAVKEHNLDIQRQDEKLDMYNLKVQRVCIPCDFVHELQHALRLCGIEKTIEL